MFDRLRGVLGYILDNPSNEGQKLRRLAMAAGWQLWKRAGGAPLIITLDNGLRFIAEPASGNSVGVIYTRIYEPEYVLFLRKHIVPDGSIIDVGAHAGLFTLLLAHLCRGGACFEPAPDTFQLIGANFRLNDLSAYQLVNAAVGKQDGSIGFAIQQSFGGGNKIDDSSTLRVPLLTIDSHLAKNPLPAPLSLFKIDVEGAELEVLEGARKTLESNPAALLIIENNDAAVLDKFLFALGWKTFAIGANGAIEASADKKKSAYNLLACGPAHPLHRELA